MCIFDRNNANPMIELKRTYHPVGQGAFYTEVFMGPDRTEFVMVYDCGSETAVKDMERNLDDQIEEFKNSIGPNPHIDLLFLSHFHADHINGLDKLLENVTVGKTVIPMLPSSVITLTRVRNFLKYNEGAQAADAVIKELYLEGEHSGRFGEVVKVSPDREGINVQENKHEGSDSILYSGSKLEYYFYWEFIPFNSVTPSDQRAVNFMKELKKIPGVLEEENLNVNKLIRGCRKRVREAYRKAMQNANDNLCTLVVESKPAENVNPKPDTRKSHAIYFGDFDCKKNDELWGRFKKFFDLDTIGTIQVPHHGSKENWKDEMKDGDSREYVVSSGSTNCYHHPDFWVVADIVREGHVVHVVNEEIASKYEQCFRVF